MKESWQSPAEQPQNRPYSEAVTSRVSAQSLSLHERIISKANQLMQINQQLTTFIEQSLGQGNKLDHLLE
jgi:hypothetical protein